MNSLAEIKNFFSSGAFAIVGVSKNPRKFGNTAYTTLKSKGIPVYPVNNTIDSINGDICYHSLKDLKGKTTSALLVVPPEKTLQVLQDAIDAGITQVWFQPGSESKEGSDFCKQHSVQYITGQCIIMHAEPVQSAHKIHRFFRKLTGNFPR